MATPASKNGRTPSRVLGGAVDSVVDDDFGTPASNASPGRARPPRMSFASRLHRPSRGANWRNLQDEEALSPAAERPAIPSALRQSGEVFSTPLPLLPMIVLSIVMLGEFLSANVSTPFLLFMVEGFGVSEDEAGVGYWTGILVSCFFITQFLTSLLWATAAEKHGIRTVLFVSLLGSSLTCFAFGTATSLPQAMCIRLLQGVFAGAIGVGRGNVVTITDPSNEGRAYAILGFCWGFGGVAGAIIGGSFERPAEKWPGFFSNFQLFVRYPYLLPTTIAATITGMGALLSLFLARDGGPREGAIKLYEKDDAGRAASEEPFVISALDDTDEPTGMVNRLKHKVSKKLSGYFARRVHEAHGGSPLSPGTRSSPVPMARRSSNGKLRTFSRTSRANGSAYGYGTSYRNRLASGVSLAGRRGSLASTLARRRDSVAHQGNADISSTPAEGGDELNFAQRLLMANENAVNNITDLWVAAAMNVDNEDVFLSDSEVEEQDDDPDDDPFRLDEDEESVFQTPSRPTRSSTPRALGSAAKASSPLHPSSSVPRPHFGSPRVHPHRPSFTPTSSDQRVPSSATRRPSTSFPAIFSHTGVRTPPAALEPPAQPLALREGASPAEAGGGEGLEPIFESRPVQSYAPKQQVAAPQTTVADEPLETINEKQQSMWSLLPLAIILQYGMLALHSTTHDQIFLSYLVSKYQSGGLNLNAGHFAQLIALMSLASIAYQFYLYPNMGPPRGRFSHLAMFRIGSLLFIPAYLSVTLYRPLASAEDDGNMFLMAALVFSTALRYAGITFAYTAVAILLNYMSPPHLLGYANGIAQSIVSFARFVGPVLGGYLWSVSVDGNPSGYPLGFIICSCVTLFAVAHSFLIR